MTTTLLCSSISPSRSLPFLCNILLVSTWWLVLVNPAAQALVSPQPVSVGIDLGTSGARISAVKSSSTGPPEEVFSAAFPWKDGAYDDPEFWVNIVDHLLQLLHADAPGDGQRPIQSICVSGTSASCLIYDTATGTVSRPPRMYDYNVLDTATTPSASVRDQVQTLLDTHVPPRHTTRSGTSSLAKLLAWHVEEPLRSTERLLHQADYVAYRLAHQCSEGNSPRNYPITIVSDWHNCLKLGYDVRADCWPSWFLDCAAAVGIADTVWPTRVVSPGTPSYPSFVAGTTDSNAAFVAGVSSTVVPGVAVTSLGSTVALKQVSKTYVEDADRGVYSHRCPSVLLPEDKGDNVDELWLVGGASNVGCAVLRELEFSTDELDKLSQQIDPTQDSPLEYYPLTKRGERFPVADTEKEPVLDPVPENRADFLHGVLQGIGDVERDGYVALEDLGALPRCQKVWTCGGGSRNDMWTHLRQRRLRACFPGVEVDRAVNVEASYGAALLAEAGATSTISS